MAYFDCIGQTVFTNPDSGAMVKAAPWVLTTRAGRKLEIVHKANPTGHDLKNARGPKNNTLNQYQYIFICQSTHIRHRLQLTQAVASRVPIPRDEKDQWKTVDAMAFTSKSGSEASEDEYQG